LVCCNPWFPKSLAAAVGFVRSAPQTDDTALAKIDGERKPLLEDHGVLLRELWESRETSPAKIRDELTARAIRPGPLSTI
jgi:hypothetical protein